MILVADEKNYCGKRYIIYGAAYVHDKTKTEQVRWVPNLRQVIQKLAALFRQSSITLLPENRQQRQRKTTMYDTYGELYTGEGGEEEEEEE